MTGRKTIQQSFVYFVSSIFLCIIIGISFIFVSGFLAIRFHAGARDNDRLFLFLFIPGITLGILLSGAVLSYFYHLVRCPWCQADFQKMASPSILNKMKCCPFCMTMLDDDIPMKPSKPQPKKKSADDELA